MGPFKQDLAQITQAGLYRKLREISSAKGPRVIIDGKTVLLMASNDYLGFCSHPAIKKAAQDAISVWGTGAGASRLISGTISLLPLYCSVLLISMAYASKHAWLQAYQANQKVCR